MSSLNRFGAWLREYHLDIAVRAFGFLKQIHDPQLYINHRYMQFNRAEHVFDKLVPDFLLEYPYAKEEVDPIFLHTLGMW